jgi:20S proteasome alpha/beta subunit
MLGLKPRPGIPPKAGQHPPQKRMTIALGILAADGIVIAADTQETTGGTKTHGEKVSISATKKGVIAVTGAGAAGYLDAMAQEVQRDFLKSRKTDVEVVIRNSFARFYARHITPLYPFDKRFPDPDISAIIGIDSGGRGLILANEQTAIRECHQFVAVGAGQEHASIILGRTFIPNLPLTRAALLAAYTIYSVKEYVEGCGKNTEVYMLHQGKCSTYWRWDQEELDRQFKQYSDAEMVLLHHVLGRVGTVENILPAIEMTRGAIEKTAKKPRLLGSPKRLPRSEAEAAVNRSMSSRLWIYAAWRPCGPSSRARLSLSRKGFNRRFRVSWVGLC